jgi:hypothetical protein
MANCTKAGWLELILPVQDPQYSATKQVDNMKAETPAEGILKRSNWGDAITYQVTCECHDSNHDHNVWVEADDHSVTVTTYTTQKSKWWSLNRWQTIWILLTRGYVEHEANIIMTKQQALNYAETLKKAIKDVEKFNEDKKNGITSSR